ncbi:MAG: 50S ribosomal protein L25 [Anaerolineae bacterium]|nr:50S ribosomal protein L25 [Anaerolineae bacterium]
MEKIVLKATRRTGKATAKAIRREGLLPAILYGHNFAPTAVTLESHESNLKLAGLSSSTIINIELDGQIHATLIREKQKDYIRNKLIHVDFLVVSMTEKLRATVGIHLEGVSPAVKDFNGVVVSNITEVEVEALPQYLPERIVVDISKLAKIGDSIHVRDLVVPAEVVIHEDMDELVVVVSATKEETEELAEGSLAEPEVIERGKKVEEDID